MPIAADRPGAQAVSRAVTLRIKRGAKLLSDVKIGRSRVIVGGGKTAQLRLKNAGLADECIVLDTRNEPFGIENRLGPDDVRVNGRAILSSLIRVGDIIELAGLTLELIDGDPAARAADAVPPAAAPRSALRPAVRPPAPPSPPAPPPVAAPSLPEEAIDPYLGKNTAAKVNKGDLERARQLIEAKNAAGAAASRPVIPPARPAIPPPVDKTTPSSRPPWIELVGDESVSEPRLYLKDGTTAGRQGDVRVRHPSVSKKHARFTVEDGRLFVEDLGSTNGVWINRERIQAKSPLVEGDVLHLGAVEFAVRIPAGAEVTNFAAQPDLSNPAARIDRASGASEEGERAGRRNADQARIDRASGASEEGERAGRRNADQARIDRETEFESGTGRGARRNTERESASARNTELDSGSRRNTERESASVIPRARESRDLRTESEGVPSSRAADVWAQEAAEELAEMDSRSARDRGTEREIPAAKGRRPAEPALRSPFEDAELEIAPTGTGRPGRRDETDREGVKSAQRLSAPVPQVQKSPTPSSLFGDVEDLSEKYSKDQLKPPARLERAPVRTTVRPPEPLTRDALLDDDFVPRKRRSFGKMVGVAILGMLFGGVFVGGLAVWPRIAAVLGTETPIADGSLDRPDGPDAAPTAKPKSKNPGGKTKDPRTKEVANGTPVKNGGAPEVGLPHSDDTGDVDIEGGMEDGPKSIFEDAPLDLRSDARLDKELASLEKDVAEKGLRAERAIGADELKSIFLGESTATVRRLYNDDGFNQAPSAADEDPRDAEAKRQGAKQIDPNRVNALIRDKFPAVKRCLVGASVKRGKARVVVEFTIQPSGKTENVSVIDSDIGGSSFKSCVSSVVSGIKFPKTKDQSVVVQFPFVFTYN